LTTPALGTPASGILTSCTGVNYDGYKNRIINGAMVIDQRNAGASVTPASGSYTLDRWIVETSQASKFSLQQNQGSVTPPAGFSNYLGITSLANTSLGAGDYFMVEQRIEGFNTADLDFGKSTAKTITLSFWVRSSLTGNFGGALGNSAGNRSYPFTYTISSANTWTQISVTIAGDTTGTWIGATNGAGLIVYFGLGMGSTYSGTAGSWASSLYFSATGATSVVGTNGATFYITGVQLEKGSTATSFDYRPYGTELALCQRYYCKTFDIGTAPGNNITTSGAFMLGNISSGNYEPSITWRFPVDMRTAPTLTLYNPETGTTAQWSAGGGTVSAGARALFVATSSAVIDNTDVTLTGLNSWRIQAASSAEL
jgi:hypothetical protein